MGKQLTSIFQRPDSRPIVSPLVQQFSIKSIIIALCVAILLWMVLQGSNKHGAKSPFQEHEKVDKTDLKTQSTIDKAKEALKTTYDETADIAKNTLHDVLEKLKDGKDNLKTIYDKKFNEMEDSVQGNKEHLRGQFGHIKDNVIETAKDTIDSIKQKSRETIESVKLASQETLEKAKETLTGTQENVLHMLDMVGLIEQAESTLHEFLSPHLKSDEQLPLKTFSKAKAIVFLQVVKGGMGLSGVFGTGIVIARNEIGKWSGPCAIALMGVDIGLNIGVEKSDHMIILHDDAAVSAFASKGQLKLGMDASIAVGPKGRDASMSLSVGDKGYAAMHSYSISKGAYIGLSFEGEIITVRNDCNEGYYGKKVDATEILKGKVKPPKNKHLKKMHKTIDEYTARGLVYPEHSTDL